MNPPPNQRGHFELESGLHTDTWLELETAFVDPAKMRSHTDALAELVRPFAVSAICGPVTGGALVAQAVASRLGLRFYYSERVSANPQSGLFAAKYRLPQSVRAQAANERF